MIFVVISRFEHKITEGIFVFKLKIALAVIFLSLLPFGILVFGIAHAMFE